MPLTKNAGTNIRLRPVAGGRTGRSLLRPVRNRREWRHHRSLTQWPHTLNARGQRSDCPARWTVWATRLMERYTNGWPVWDRVTAVLWNCAAPPVFALHTASPGHRGGFRPLVWPLHLTLRLVTATVSPQKQVAPNLVAATPTAHPDVVAPDRRLVFPGGSQPLRAPLLPASAALLGRQSGAQAGEAVLLRLQRPAIPWTSWHETALVQRLVARRPAPQGDSAPPANVWSETRPVPRVISRPVQRVTPDVAQETPSLPHPLPYWEDVGRLPARVPIDVERLTDQVLRSLDQRVIAARERLGRG
jgi:hypothetical protein